MTSVDDPRTCERCGASFTPVSGRRSRFCSQACAARHQGGANRIESDRCAAPGCAKARQRTGPTSASRYCRMHLARLRRYGELEPTLERPRGLTVRERVERRIDRDGPVPERRPDLGPCHLWMGSRDPAGYGQLGGRSAHRLIYENDVGPIPSGMVCDHLCGVRSCVNPEHIEVVTRSENAARAGRAGAGKKKPRRRACVCATCGHAHFAPPL